MFKKESFIKKAPPTKVKGFQLSLVDLNQTSEMVFSEIWSFSGTGSLYIFIKIFSFRSYKEPLKFEEDWIKLSGKIYLCRQPPKRSLEERKEIK